MVAARKRIARGSPDKAAGAQAGPAGPRSADILLDAAFELFARQNYSSVTIKDIAEATGFNASLIYYYHGSKEALFMRAVEAAVRRAFAHFEVISREAAAPEEVIGLWIELHIAQYAPLQKLARISLDYASTRNRTPPVDAAIAAFYEREADLLRGAIREGIASGRFRAVDPEAEAEFVSTFLDGALFRKAMLPDFDPASAIRYMRMVVLRHLMPGAA